MVGKDIKDEARKKLALNMHQAIVIYTVEFTIFITLIALVVMSCVTMEAINSVAAIVMICYGVLLLIVAIVGAGMINFAMTDFYLISFKCQPYNVRRLGETIARCNITKVLLLSLKRTVIAFLLTLCLIVPGVIYMIRTSMAYFLLIANPKMKPSAALTASGKVMSGKTGSYFSLMMSMFGWYLLGLATLGLGFIFINPYINLVKTVFYKRNLQGDKGVYTVSPQAMANVPYATSMPMQQQTIQPMQPPVQQPVQQQNVTPAQAAQPAGPAPIDALAVEDVMDMNSAIQDFGGTPTSVSVDEVPEVPLAAPVKNKQDKQTKLKLTREEKRLAKEAAKQEESRKVVGVGLVETERTLSTQEISYSDQMQRNELEHMYSNAARQQPKVNYFDVNGSTNTNSPDFDDDFGVTPSNDDVQDFGTPAAAPIVEPIIDPIIEPEIQPIIEQEPIVGEGLGDQFVEPVMSDSELDEFLRNFDIDTDEGSEALPDIEPVVDEPVQPAKPDNGGAMSAAERRKQAEERIARDRQAAADRLAKTRRPSNSFDLDDRAERVRRERELRLKNQQQKK